jgi:hypothetical protein
MSNLLKLAGKRSRVVFSQVPPRAELAKVTEALTSYSLTVALA